MAKKRKKPAKRKTNVYPSHQHNVPEGHAIRHYGNAHSRKKTYTQDIREGKIND